LEQTGNVHPLKRRRSIWFVLLIIAIVLGSFQALYNTTGSMDSTVVAGETMLIEKISFGISTQNLPPILCDALPYKRFLTVRLPAHGETVVFRHTGERDLGSSPPTQLFMKRCVATSGDTVQLRGGTLYVNGIATQLPRTASQIPFSETRRAEREEQEQYRTFPVGRAYTSADWGPMRVPKHGDTLWLDANGFHEWTTFVQREGHDVNIDACTVDDVPAAAYVVERDYMFALGDNRSNSVDSRFIGFVPTNDVIGTPLIILKAVDPETGSFIWNRVGTIIH